MMFNETVGAHVEIENKSFFQTIAGMTGHALYGPYEVVQPGRYLVTFAISAVERQALEPGLVCGRVDVVSHLGHATLAWQDFTFDSLGDHPALITLSFTLVAPTELEYRVSVTGELALMIDAHPTVIKLSDAPAARVERAATAGFPDPSALPKPTVFVHNPREFRRLYERGVDLELLHDAVRLRRAGQMIDIQSDGQVSEAERLWPYGSRLTVSYAQVREDVTLLQALDDVSRDDGFYIDVGANHPSEDSVTQLFYDRGWRGINVEPSVEWFELLESERPRDINIRAAVSNRSGEVIFHDNVGGQLGTLVDTFADRYENSGAERRSYAVPALTLTEICELHGPKDIHFLKIDVEGHEGQVLEGMDFGRFRPWILAIEATEPNRFDALTHLEWDGMVRDAGYVLATVDIPNRYYVAAERAHLAARFAAPPDNYVWYRNLPETWRAA